MGKATSYQSVMEWAAGQGSRKVAQFAERIFGIRGGNDEKKGRKGVEALRRWFDKIGTPTTFTAAKIPSSDIPKIADYALDLANTLGLNGYTRGRIVELYNLCV